MHRKQLQIFFSLLIVYALCALLTYSFFTNQLAATVGVPLPDMGVSDVQLGLANAGTVLVVYGILGLLGYWFAKKLELPGIYRENAGWQQWGLIPLILGAVCGLLLIGGDTLFAQINGFGHFPHPSFPLSIIASLSAGIGEEIVFRSFIMGLWGLIFSWIFRQQKFHKGLLWVSNIIAALAFSAGHLGTLMLLTGSTTLAEINPVLLLEIFILNGLAGIVAGQQYIKNGLVSAAGVHFWTDVVWHVLWGLSL